MEHNGSARIGRVKHRNGNDGSTSNNALDGCWWLAVWSIGVIVVVDLGDVEKFAPGFLLLTLPNKHIQLVHKMIQVVRIALDDKANR